MYPELTMSNPIRVSRFMPIDASKIRALRIQLGWTQADLARVAGYSERLVRKAEAGGTLSIGTIRDIAEALSACGRTISVGDLTLDLSAVATQFLQCYDAYGKSMPYRCEHLLAEDFVFCNYAHHVDVKLSGTWMGSYGLEQFMELFFGSFERSFNSLKPTFEYRKNLVLARYSDMLVNRGKEFPMAVTQTYQFHRGLICRIDQVCRAYGLRTMDSPTEDSKGTMLGQVLPPKSRWQA